MNDVWMINQRINKLVPIAKKQIDEGDFRNAQETTEIIQRLTQWRRELMIKKNQQRLLESQAGLNDAVKKVQNAVIGATYAVNKFVEGVSAFANCLTPKNQMYGTRK